MSDSKKKNKTGFVVAGILLVLFAIMGDNLKYINDWSTAELVGYNIWGVVLLTGGIYLIYKGIKK